MDGNNSKQNLIYPEISIIIVGITLVCFLCFIGPYRCIFVFGGVELK